MGKHGISDQNLIFSYYMGYVRGGVGCKQDSNSEKNSHVFELSI